MDDALLPVDTENLNCVLTVAHQVFVTCVCRRGHVFIDLRNEASTGKAATCPRCATQLPLPSFPI